MELKMKIKLFKILILLTQLLSFVSAGCIDMWNTGDDHSNQCPVLTQSGEFCSFPFQWNNATYETCIIHGPNNQEQYPQCVTTSGKWSICNVPLTSVISYVTTRKSGWSSSNGASVRGETLVWIHGRRFAKNAFSTVDTNKVILRGQHASYDCELHADKTTETQITCYTPALPEGIYFVKVYVNGWLIPSYQYVKLADGTIKSSLDSTPQLNRLTPNRGLPGSFVNISGNFNSECYGRDVSTCSDDGSSRISRVYFGPQQCDLIDPVTSQLYANLSATSLLCRLKGTTVAIFNASMLVSEGQGRSQSDSNMFLVTPDELIYNYQTYAEITSIAPTSGSLEGGTSVKITGKYLYHSQDIPANIQIGNEPCNVISFDNTDLLNTIITCETSKQNSPKFEYVGNRGISVTREDVLTQFSSLENSSPSLNSETFWLDEARYIDNRTFDVTIWLKGFIVPRKSSDYYFSVSTNGNAKLFLSNDSTSANKRLVASYELATKNQVDSTSKLEASEAYYFEAIFSKPSGDLQLSVNAKLLDTVLNSKLSSMVKTEIQEVAIKSNVVPETWLLSYADLNQTNNATGEIQELILISPNSDDFVLNFDGAQTIRLPYGSSAEVVKKALNDLPNLYPDGVDVKTTYDLNGDLVYRILFTPVHGDVPLISESYGKVLFIANETQKGVPSQAKIQIKIQDSFSGMFDVKNGSLSDIKKAINEVFSIRCPNSIQKMNSTDIFALYDYENECEFDETPLNNTAFCGQCSRKNKESLFWGVKSPFTYNYLCFAYKTQTAFSQINLLVMVDNDPLFQRLAYAYPEVIPNNEWHYMCVDMYQAVLSSWSTIYGISRLTLISAYLYPTFPDFYVDVVSIRSALPFGYPEVNRVLPPVQLIYQSLSVSRINQTLTIKFRPSNCLVNLNHSEIRQEVNGVPSVSTVATTSGSVIGTFSLSWNGTKISNIPANVEAQTLRNMLQSVPGMELVDVIRSQDCSGYKYRIEWFYGGDKPQILVQSSSLSGPSPSITIKTIVNGGIEYYPIPGDMLRTLSSNKPEVSVLVNGIPSKCAGSCNFDYSLAATPIVTSIDTSNPLLIQIQGNGFDSSNIGNNIVLIGETSCIVTSATQTSLRCQPSQGPVGTYPISVTTIDKGLAQMNVQTNFTFSLIANSFSPLVVGVGGGALLSLTGNGFSSRTKVLIDNNECEIKSFTYNSIECFVPKNPTNADKLVNIQLVDGPYTTLFGQQLKYDRSNTPIVISVFPYDLLSVLGGETITIIGNGFNTSLKQLFIGSQMAPILSMNSTTIIIISPSLNPGLYSIKIPSGDLGNAYCDIELNYDLHVSSFSPSISSIRGGSLVTIHGNGFSSNCSLNKVSFGNSIGCLVKSCSSQWIQCQTQHAYKTHIISNQGIHPIYGRGYAWSTPIININKGDYIEWKWTSPETIGNINYAVYQVNDSMSQDKIGFISGISSPSGSYLYQFNSEGTFYYTSGYVDSNQLIELRGVINVGPTIDTEEEINVEVNAITALKCKFPFSYKNISYSSCTSIDFGYNWCSIDAKYSGRLIKCDSLSTPSTPSCPGTSNSCSINLLSKNNLAFTTCSVPIVTSVSQTTLSVGDLITITGSGFSLNTCENEILFGSYSCPIMSATSTQLQCRFGNTSNLIPNIFYKLEILRKNIGFALQDQWFEFQFIPKITSISPSIGSIAGGTLVTILGDGFVSSTTALSLPCDGLPQITYNQIIFKTRSDSSGLKTLAVQVNSVRALCALSNNCSFEFATLGVATLGSITPSLISKAANLTLSGTNFGTDPTKVSVLIGEQNCVINSCTGNSITCFLNGLELGNHSVILTVNPLGNAIQTQLIRVTGQPSLISVQPQSGSLNGGQLITILGNGFGSLNNTKVTIGGAECRIQSINASSLTCLSPSGQPGTTSLDVLSSGVTYPSLNYTYDQSSTPFITQISPNNGPSGTLITIIGTGFGSIQSDATVFIGASQCSIQNFSSSQITCLTEQSQAGSFSAFLQINSKGYSNTNWTFNSHLVVNSISTSQGSFAGGLELTLTGSGFAGLLSNVSICQQACLVTDFIDTTQIRCLVPSRSYSAIDINCDLVVDINGQSVTKSFVYVSSLTPLVNSVSPLRGGTGGGTLITIVGSNFPLSQSDIHITIAGSLCSIASLTINEIKCYTGPYVQSSIKAPVLVFIRNVGYATATNQVDFNYIDLWSSVFTWGGSSVPKEGEIVVIGPGQTIYFDAITPIIKGLIIQGGSLIFDDNQDVHLMAEYIIITDGGKLQVGSEIQPFTHKATITMFGTLRSIELPIYGAKVIALRNGTLDIHGKPVGITWTHLGKTASIGSTTIELKEPVEWPIGGQIVIATTGNYQSQGESEVHKIVALSTDGKTITLDTALKFTHLSEIRSVGGGISVEIRAEVGLLSRNVKINAANDNTWNSLRSSSSCPDDFNPGEFATMTCFLGRYGEEIGSDEFGATIMIHSPVRNQIGAEIVIARFSNVELTHVGQAFRLGRYPIHFHLIGDSPSSYVRECVIHQSFNRAVNIHATNYINVERTVIYNIMGGAFFLEDGVEHGNTFNGNLAVYVKVSSSGINEDSTPAAFWITNPNNTYLNNAVAGGTHFGYWYRILDRSDGPSFNPNYCPKKQPFGQFKNNSVHSVGRFGLWIFPGYTPSVTGGCYDMNPSVAQFEQFYSYGCDKGAEWVEASSLQFKKFIVFDHISAGIETKTIAFHDNLNTPYASYFYNETIGSLVKDSIIIGTSDPNSSKAITEKGLIVAWERGELIKNVTFINFPDVNSYAIGETSIDGRCKLGCGGWEVQFSQIKFVNVLQRSLHRWNWDYTMKDIDGSLTDTTPGSLVLYAGNITLKDNRCKASSLHINGLICTAKNQIRFSFNKYLPDMALIGTLKNDKNITDYVPMFFKRLTHGTGFMMALEANRTHLFDFDSQTVPTNISYKGGFYSLRPYEYIIVNHTLLKKPDQVSFSGSVLAVESPTPLSIESNAHQDWHWDNSTSTLSYILHNRAGKLPHIDVDVTFFARKCRYSNCDVAPKPYLKSPSTSRPSNALYWCNTSTWQNTEYGWGGNYGNGQYGLPRDGDSVKIALNTWIVVDCQLPKLKQIYIEGVLEFDDTLDNKLSVNEIFINGGELIIGWETQPFQHNVEIELTGAKGEKELYLPNGVESIGNKAIGVFGGLDLHGRLRNPIWTKLAKTANKGENSVTLDQAVDWQIDEEVAISSTSYNPFETETFKITAISSDLKTITLNASLNYNHLVALETFSNGESYTIAASVGLLTRNIKITGGEYSAQFDDLFGSRVIVSDYSIDIFAEGETTPTPVYYKGYARLSNVQFARGGQFTRASDDDFKYAILYSNLGDYDIKRPSYVRDCSFHNSFSAAIGIAKSNGIPIINNVIHHTIDFSLRISGEGNIVKNNMIVLNVWSPTYKPYLAPFDIFFWGAIDLRLTNTIIFEDNFIAGCERVALFYRGSPCVSNSNHSIARNTIYGSLAGVTIFPDYALSDTKCIKISEFTIYKSIYWGIYYNAQPNLQVESNKLIDNTVGVFNQVIKPTSTSHTIENKYIQHRNNLLVGTSPSFNCEPIPNSLVVEYSHKAASSNTPSGGRIGIFGANFVDGPNKAPLKPWSGLMTYNALGGLMTIENVTFTHFGTHCNGQIDAALTNCKNNDDGQHPINTRLIHLEQVDKISNLYYFRPNLGKINPSDCVDMDCDGLKKNLLTDLDGTFLGATGSSAISQSEFGWNDQDRGLGDYRIPLAALSDANGNALSPSAIYNKPGIVRDETQCSFDSQWQAYKCNGLEYKLLIIESMDHDTEDRRLSPVAIISDNKYLDLINGPQDHGWCFGYTCQKRLSTFMALVASNKHYDIFLSSTPPNKLRFRVINANSSFNIRLSMYYPTTNSIYVYKADKLVDPTNADRSSGFMILKDPLLNSGNYMPLIGSFPGSNFMQKTEKKVYFTIDGSDYIDLMVSPELFISFGIPALSADTFFNSANLVSNVASLLGVPSNMIRRVQIVSEGNVTRALRSTTVKLKYLQIVITNDPIQWANDTSSRDLSIKDIELVSSRLINQAHIGTLQERALNLFNLTIETISYQLTPLNPLTQNGIINVKKPAKIIIVQEFSDCRAQSPCDKQAIVKMVDQNGELIKNLGISTQPWTLVANLKSSSEPTSVINSFKAKIVNGEAVFENFGLSSNTRSFIIEFTIEPPLGLNSSLLNSFIEQTNPQSVTNPLLGGRPNDKAKAVLVNQDFSISFSIKDIKSGKQVANISWKSFDWYAKLNMFTLSKYQLNANLTTQQSTVKFDPSGGLAMFTNLTINQPGMYLLSANIYSSDGSYNFNTRSNSIRVLPKQTTSVYVNDDDEPNIKFLFDGDYDALVANEELEHYKAMFHNYIQTQHNATIIGEIFIYKGSVGFAFNVDPTIDILQSLSTSVNSSDNLLPGLTLKSLDIYGYTFAVKKEQTTTSDSGLNIGAIVGGLIAGLIVVALIVTGSVFGYKYYKYKQEQKVTDDVESLRSDTPKSLEKKNKPKRMKGQIPKKAYPVFKENTKTSLNDIKITNIE